MRYAQALLIWLVALVLVGEATIQAAPDATATVNSTADTDSRDGVLTLREAMLLATGGLSVSTLDSGECAQVSNGTFTPPCGTTDTIGATAADTIVFDTGVFPSGTPTTITLSSVLPGLGTGNDTVSAASAGVIVDGVSKTFTCFVISGEDSDNNTIAGLQIKGCTRGVAIESGADNNIIGGTAAGERNVISANSNGVEITGASTTGNTVQGNYIGTNAVGTAALANSTGVSINGAASNTIGGTTATERNVISGNSAFGVQIVASGATGNDVQGNYIGTDATGAAPLGNDTYGVLIITASGNTIGGTTAGAGNVISGNSGRGIYIAGSGTTGNLVQGNYIGTDAAGTADLGNLTQGVSVNASASNNTIGGTTGTTPGGPCTGACNLISGNDSDGVAINGSTTTGNTVAGNYIGTDVNGTADLGNSAVGVRVDGTPGSTIGGTTGTTPGGSCTGACNLISGNDSDGVAISGSTASANTIQGNYIGTDVNGTADLGNSAIGVRVDAAPGNTIGGTTGGARNIISGNDDQGVRITGSGATGNHVRGNYIGTDVNGTSDLGNSFDGVLIQDDATNNTIGGTAFGTSNVISGNDARGVLVVSSGTTGNLVRGNYIGTAKDGTSGLGNSSVGVHISGAPGNTIGGPTPAARNVISSNSFYGVFVSGSAATGNDVQGNYIGTDLNGVAALGNTTYGVYVSGPNNTIGGTAAEEGNVISGNNGLGVYLAGSDASGNLVQGNYIGTQADGTTPLGNTSHGVEIDLSASNNTIGGTVAGAGNTVAFNGGYGVVAASGASNAVERNSIHSNTGLGIDLGADGVTANDPGDGDTGANNLQNFPALTSVLTFGGSTIIEGHLNSAATTSFAIELFSNTVCDPAGNGEGKTFLDSTTAMTDGSGDVSFALAVTPAVPAGQFITATATDPNANTSEFSECEQVNPDSDGDGIADAVDVCPDDANNDADSDGICVGDGFQPPKTGDNDNCPSTANAGQENADGDAWGDACDNCPAVATVWFVPVGDDDCDGFTTAFENYLGTDPNVACGVNAWPPDTNDDTIISNLDFLLIVDPANWRKTVPPASPRADIYNGDGFIGNLDFLPIVDPARWLQACT